MSLGSRVVQIDRRQKKTTDEAARAARGFGPASMPDSLALTGDTPTGSRAARLGEKSGMLLAPTNTWSGPDHVHQWTVKPRGALALATTLAEHRADALLYRKLATLVDTAPLAESLEDLRFGGVPRARFEAWCAELDATAIATMPKVWAD
jgi:hypothetical protein